ncbi:helix-turn-helix domain-containing protein [Falsiroseomonas tokyonensis]|uniref:Helix-turn-helix domain-containing protein n=1 Tax=Falsiroseomonas tokyonensis TaxID=430521 RepID=A0ABV7BZG0_9PROT|nr:AraC family transcriptional regulator [Falsiroseomonas tokyonensis]MBU8540637.1 helix-turn-helix transcriptional regulator [Falsiroseomonas tokyonensis]
MSRDTPVFTSHAEFYKATYGSFMRDFAPLGRSGAAMILAEQTAGDFSDLPTEDIVLVRPLTSSPGLIDCGAGRRHQTTTAGAVSIVPPRFTTTVVMDTPHGLDLLAIPYRRLLDLTGPDILPEDGNFGALHAGFNLDRTVTAGFETLWRQGRSGSPDPLLVDAALLTIFSRFVAMSRSKPVAVPQGGLAAWQVRRATAYMMDNLDSEIGLAELSALVGLSPTHFCTAFRRSTGLPPHAWLTEARMERAKALLADPRLSLTEIAQTVGYGGQSAFGAAFRRATGTTPRAWRRQTPAARLP